MTKSTKLIWKKVTGTAWNATTPFGITYRIQQERSEFDASTGQTCLTLEDAKAACQTDYDSRFPSASTDTSPGRVDQIRKRLSDATDGPWTWRKQAHDGVLPYWTLGPGVLLAAENDGTPGGDEHDRANASLIAHAPEDLEWLLGEREALRRLVGTLLTEDPNDYVSDGGHTVLDMWRHDARKALEQTS